MKYMSHVHVAPTPTKRVHSFDGLRGLFALGVFLFHLWGSIAGGALNDGSFITFLISATPLTSLLAGWQFVLSFFILSGFALTIPVLAKAGKFNWLAYYPARVVRLYLPAAASVLLAIVLLATFAIKVPKTKAYEWLAHQSVQGVNPTTIQQALTFDNSGIIYLNPALWSLKWEFIFSLLLPVMIAVAVLITRRIGAWWSLLITFTIIALGLYSSLTYPFYLGIFFVGVIIALKFDRVQVIANKVQTTVGKNFFTYGTLIVVVWLFWFSKVGSVGFETGNYSFMVTGQVLLALIATLLLMAAASVPGKMQTFLQTRGVAWLGKISFSLYLTHFPIVLTLAYIIPPARWYLLGLIAIPLCLLVAAVFHYVVEGQFHKLARLIKRFLEKTTNVAWFKFADAIKGALNTPINVKR